MTIREQIAALEAQAKVEEEAARKEGTRLLAAWKPVYEWRVEAKFEWLFRVERRAVNAGERQAIIDAYPGCSWSGLINYAEWHGMNYAIVRGDYLISQGGGVVVLKAGSSWGDAAPKLTLDEIEGLERGIVPKRLMW